MGVRSDSHRPRQNLDDSRAAAPRDFGVDGWESLARRNCGTAFPDSCRQQRVIESSIAEQALFNSSRSPRFSVGSYRTFVLFRAPAACTSGLAGTERDSQPKWF
jgi:hypothetical protein